MDGDYMEIREFLRESIEKNEMEARNFLLEERTKKVRALSNNNGLPPLFKKKTFENYNKSSNTLAFNACRYFVDNFPTSKGLLLIGSVGLGKTHLAASIVNELNIRLYSSYFGNVIDILGFVKSTYNKNSILTEFEAIEIMTEKIDLLVIDDLGKESNSEHNLALLYHIINKLYENEKPIIITTNYGAIDLNRKLGERAQAIISRMSSMCTPVNLNGKDWRIHHER